MKPPSPSRSDRLLRGAVLVAGLALAAATLSFALRRSSDAEPTVGGRTPEAWSEALRHSATSKEASEALMTLGARAYPGVGRLLADRSYNVRWRALCLLRDIPGDAVAVRDDVSRALAASPEAAEVAILLALAERMGPEGAPLAPQVARFVLHDEAVVRRTAWRTLLATGSTAEVLLPILPRVLAGPDDTTDALRCVEGLGEAALPAVPDLERWLLGVPTSQWDEPLGQAESAALRVLERLGARQPRARTALRRLVLEGRPVLAARATRGLQALVDRDPALLDELMAVLRRPDGTVRTEVLQALIADARRSRALLPRLLELLEDNRPGVRVLATGAIGRLGRDGVPALPALLDVLVLIGGDPDVRRAVEAIGAEAPEALADALPLLPRQGLDDLVAVSQGVLVRLPVTSRGRVWARLTEWWLAGAVSTTPGGEESLAILLAGMGARESQVNDPLLPALESDDAGRRVRAALLLGRLPGRRALLLDRLESPEPRQRQAALLGLRGGQPVDARTERNFVLAAMGDTAPEVRAEAVVRALESPQPGGNPLADFTPAHRKAALTSLVEILGTGTPERRRFAAGALRLFPDAPPEAIAALGTALASPDEELRATAADVLGTTGQPLGPAAGPIVARFDAAKEPVEIQAALRLVVRAGAAANGAAVRIAALYAAVKDSNLRRELLEALGRIDPPPETALPVFRAALADADESLQLLALSSIATLGKTMGAITLDLLRLAGETAGDAGRRRNLRERLDRALGALGASPEAHAAFLAHLREGDVAGRDALVATLGPYAKQEAGWLHPLLVLLRGEDVALRRAAVGALLASGRPVKEAAPELLAALVDVPLTQIELGVPVLTGHDASAQDVVPALLRLHELHPGSSVIADALQRLGPKAPRALVEGLQGAPHERKAFFRELLARAQREWVERPDVPSVADALATWMEEGSVPPESLGKAIGLLDRLTASPVEGARLPKAAALAAAFDTAPRHVLTDLLRLVRRSGTAARGVQPRLVELLRASSATPPDGAPRASGELAGMLDCLAEVGKDMPGTWTAVVGAWAGARDESERHAVGSVLRRLAPTEEEDPRPLFALLPEVPPGLRESFVFAVGQVGARGGPGVPWLIQRLREPDIELREHAAWALARIGPTARAALPALLPFAGESRQHTQGALHVLSVEDPETFLAALPGAGPALWPLLRILEGRLDEFLARGHGPAAAMALVETLLTPTAEFGASPATPPGSILVRLLATAPKAVERLLDAAEGPPSPVRDRVLLLASGSDAARAAALLRLNAPTAEKRLAALAVVGGGFRHELTPEERAAIAARLDDPDARVRFAAARRLSVLYEGGRGFHLLDDGIRRRTFRVALESLRTERKEDWPLETLLHSPTPSGLPEAGEELARLLLDEEDPKRAARIGGALWQHGLAVAERARGVLEPALASEDDARRARAVYCWVILGQDRARAEALLPALFASPHVLARLTAIQSCGMLDQDRSEGRPALIALLRDADARVREAAAHMLIFTAKADPAVLRAFRDVIFDPKVADRAGFVSTLALGDESVVPTLVEGLDDKALRWACLSALSGLAGKAKAALPRLERLLDEVPESDADLRRFIGSVIDTIRR